jgi:hypothetical protein
LQQQQLGFVTGHPLNGDNEKKYSTRTHTYEQTREKEEKKNERPVYSTTAVLLHLYYINYRTRDAPPTRRKEEKMDKV